MWQDVRQYIDRLHIDGHPIDEDHDDDPVLLDPGGRAVDTWRENCPERARINAMRAVLARFEYEGKDEQVVSEPDPLIVQRGRDAVGD